MDSTSEVNAKIKGQNSIEQDLLNLDLIQKQTHGPNQYIIAAMKTEISSIYRLENTINKNIEEAKNITRAVENFEKSTNKTEKVMILLAIASFIASLVQIVIAVYKG